MFARLRASYQAAREEKKHRREKEKTELIRSQAAYAKETAEREQIDKAISRLQRAVHCGDIDDVSWMVGKYGDNATVMNSLYQRELHEQLPGFSGPIDTVLTRALCKKNTAILRKLMEAPAINLDASQAWHYVTINKANIILRGTMLKHEHMPEYDPNNNKIVLLTARELAERSYPEALPILFRTEPTQTHHTPTETELFVEFLLWKKQRKEQQLHQAADIRENSMTACKL